jgi:hypothetical protein
MKAPSVCPWLMPRAALQVNMPRTWGLDKARDQKGAVVQERAALLPMELLSLPSYGPNLHRIERVWKLVQKPCWSSKYDADSDTCTTAISDCLQHTHDRHKKELDSLLT